MRLPKCFCCVTPAGRSAVATTILHSDDVVSDLRSMLVTASGHPVRLTQRVPTFGYWINESKHREGLVVSVLNSHAAEVHSHGGVVAPKMIANTLRGHGFQELSHERYVGLVATSSWNSEIQLALSQASTQRAAIHLLRLSHNVTGWLDQIELLIRNKPIRAISQLEKAISLFQWGQHLIRPWSIVIAGKPNVGKSSLINAISGFERAIVHNTPGTTRDVVSQLTAIEGWPVLFKDTAGIRETSDSVEGVGVQKAEVEFSAADLRIAVFDASQPWSEDDSELIHRFEPEVVVHNKSDIGVDSERHTGLSVSALEQNGISDLLTTISHRLEMSRIDDETFYPTNDLQVTRLENVVELIAREDAKEAISQLRAEIGTDPG